MKKKVSIILVNYNTKDLTRECINSIYEKTEGLDFDIWVVDNDSRDGSCEMIRSEFAGVNLIESKENLGFGRGNNLAISKCDAEYVFLLNTDTILVNNAVKILVDFLESNPSIGACGGNLYDENMENVHSYGVFQTVKRQLLKTFCIRFLFPDEFKQMRDRGENKSELTKPVDYITGADLLIRKSVLDEVGAFDEKFFMYSEEAELQFRIKQAGHEIFINPEAKIIHLHEKSPRNKNKIKFEFLKSKYLFFKLCYGKNNLYKIKLLMIAALFSKFLFHPIKISEVYKYILLDK